MNPPPKSLERTAAPLRSSTVAGFGDALWLSRVTGVLTAGRLSLSSVVRRKPALASKSQFVHRLPMFAQTISKLMRLPVRQRLAIAERLWLSVCDEKKMPVPEDHKRILRKRLADYRAGRSKTVSHQEIMRRLKSS